MSQDEEDRGVGGNLPEPLQGGNTNQNRLLQEWARVRLRGEGGQDDGATGVGRAVRRGLRWLHEKLDR